MKSNKNVECVSESAQALSEQDFFHVYLSITDSFQRAIQKKTADKGHAGTCHFANFQLYIEEPF